MSSYISINFRNKLDIYRMRWFCPCFSDFCYFFHSFQGVFFNFEKVKIEKYSLKTVKKVTKMGKTWTKRPHPINVQCITRIYRYVGARMMHFNKNESKIKILKIPIVWIKICKTCIHTEFSNFWYGSHFYCNTSQELLHIYKVL